MACPFICLSSQFCLNLALVKCSISYYILFLYLSNDFIIKFFFFFFKSIRCTTTEHRMYTKDKPYQKIKKKNYEIHVIVKIIQVWGDQHFILEHPQEKMQHKKSGWSINQQRKKLWLWQTKTFCPSPPIICDIATNGLLKLLGFQMTPDITNLSSTGIKKEHSRN